MNDGYLWAGRPHPSACANCAAERFTVAVVTRAGPLAYSVAYVMDSLGGAPVAEYHALNGPDYYTEAREHAAELNAQVTPC